MYSQDEEWGKLDEKEAGSCQNLKQDDMTFPLPVNGYSSKGREHHVTQAPTPRGQPDAAFVVPGPEGRLVPLDHEQHGLEFVWETFVYTCRD